MKNKSLCWNDFTESLASATNYKENEMQNTNNKAYVKMVKSLKNILYGELTQRQRMCILMYYGKKMKMREISSELEIGISSVSRHIKKGKNRIKKTMEYYFF